MNPSKTNKSTQNHRIICTVTNDLSYDQRMIRICSTLSRVGYEVLLVGRMKRNSIPLKQEVFKQVRLGSFFQSGKLMYLEYNLRLFFFLLFRKFEVINAVDLDTILPGLWVSRLKRKKLVYDAHEYFTELPEVVDRPLVKGIWERVAKYAIPRIEDAYTVSQSIAEEMGKRYGIPFTVIRNLPQQKIHTEKKRTENTSFIILYQGALNEGRGLEIAIQAMQKLESAELWLAGEGDLSESLRALAKKNEVQERVRFLGYIPPDQLHPLTTQAHLGINLLENKGLSYYYSLANKSFDYIQARLPSIQMDLPEYRLLNEKYSCFLLLSELEEEAYVKLINHIQREKQLYKKLQKNCLIAAKELIWEKEEEKLLALYYRIFFP